MATTPTTSTNTNTTVATVVSPTPLKTTKAPSKTVTINKSTIFHGIAYFVLVGLLLGGLIFHFTSGSSKSSQATSVVNGLPKDLQNLVGPGDKVTITIDEQGIPARSTDPVTYQSGPSVSAKDTTRLNRNVSPFGTSAIEGAQKMQKMDISKGGMEVDFGFFKVSILQIVWERIRGFFFWGAIITGVFVLMLFIPATAPFAGTVLRWIASIIPLIGSGIEWIISKFKVKKAQTVAIQVIQGGDEFKAALYARTDLTADQKDSLWDLFKSKQMSVQDSSTQKIVQATRTI